MKQLFRIISNKILIYKSIPYWSQVSLSKPSDISSSESSEGEIHLLSFSLMIHFSKITRGWWFLSFLRQESVIIIDKKKAMRTYFWNLPLWNIVFVLPSIHFSLGFRPFSLTGSLLTNSFQYFCWLNPRIDYLFLAIFHVPSKS